VFVDSPSLLVPVSELESRARALAARLRAASFDGAFLLHPSSAFWLTGTIADGFAFLDADGRAGLPVRRSRARSALDTSTPLAPIRRPEDLPAALASLGLSAKGRIGLEMDVVPVAVAERLKRVFPDVTFEDISPSVRAARAVKSAYEVAWIERGGDFAGRHGRTRSVRSARGRPRDRSHGVS
jgi:Xaa-Pro aminopeptidase